MQQDITNGIYCPIMGHSHHAAGYHKWYIIIVQYIPFVMSCCMMRVSHNSAVDTICDILLHDESVPLNGI